VRCLYFLALLFKPYQMAFSFAELKRAAETILSDPQGAKANLHLESDLARSEWLVQQGQDLERAGELDRGLRLKREGSRILGAAVRRAAIALSDQNSREG
jgi:hypothetical protein